MNSQQIDQLGQLVGPDRVTCDPAVLTPLSRDASYRSQKLERAGQTIAVAEAVVTPKDEADIAAVLKWCSANGVPVTPRGPGSSVMGSQIPLRGGVLLDLRHFNQVLEIDPYNRLARVQGSILLSDLETELNKHGLTGGHYPQSFYVAGVAGSMTMRGTGTFSSLYGSVEDRLAELRVVLPSGEIYQSHNSPRASTGPDLRQLFLGSEGCFGVITEVTLKVVPIPETRLYASFAFDSFEAALDTTRAMQAAGVVPAVLRIYDPVETAAKHTQFTVADGSWLMVLLYEGSAELTQVQAQIVARLAAAQGGRDMGEEPAQSWERKRFDVSWMSDQVARDGGVAEAIEIAAPWSALPKVMEAMRQAAGRTMDKVMGHVSHIYSDGACLYVISTGTKPTESEALMAYDQLWQDVMEVVIAEGAVICHHHGIGYERAPWLEAEHGAVGIGLLHGLKRMLDPAGVMNPGKLGF
ncbi:MAG: FAD-binding oxidoreductase [Propionibacteriaceae bacterium]|jgi:alkyldihydroxyacetonephosphate synthase|nr:FAD-binding oxidoreductase [Propionibacteriaceae bacterium]